MRECFLSASYRSHPCGPIVNDDTEGELESIRLLRELIEQLAATSETGIWHSVLDTALALADARCGAVRTRNANGTMTLAAQIGFDAAIAAAALEPERAARLGFPTPHVISIFDASGELLALVALYFAAGRAVTQRARHWLDLLANQVGLARRQWQDQASEERFRSIFQESNDFIVTADLQQTITYCNPATALALGWQSDEILGRSIADFIPSPHFDRTSTMLAQKLRDGGSTRYEVEVIARDGRRMTWEINSRLTFGPDGKPTGLHAIGRDVTTMRAAHEALRSSERALREADQRKNEYLAMLAHELRNPLAPIRTAAHILKSSQASAAQIEQASTIIERQVAQITRIVDDLLDVSRVMRGLVTLDMRPIVLQEIVLTAIEQIRSLIDSKQHRLQVTLPEPSIVLSGEGVRLVQMVSNLLSNAARHSGTNGTIELFVVAHPQLVEIHVRDHGAGIPAELLPRIFDLFAQGQQSAARSEGGLGIGLALVRRLAELHGGHIHATSTGPGHGAEFTIVLPRLADEAAPHLEPPVELLDAPPEPLRVLIVDDNQDAANMLALLLQTEGHTAVVEYAAKPALMRAQLEPPDVLILDIGLPDMSGYELGVRLRALPELANATLIAITGYGQDEDRRRSAQAGFDAHLMKPVSADDLQRTLRRSCPRPKSTA